MNATGWHQYEVHTLGRRTRALNPPRIRVIHALGPTPKGPVTCPVACVLWLRCNDAWCCRHLKKKKQSLCALCRVALLVPPFGTGCMGPASGRLTGWPMASTKAQQDRANRISSYLGGSIPIWRGVAQIPGTNFYPWHRRTVAPSRVALFVHHRALLRGPPQRLLPGLPPCSQQMQGVPPPPAGANANVTRVGGCPSHLESLSCLCQH